MKTNFILLGIASIIVILVMSAKKKEAFREGQRACINRDSVRVSGRWQDCCVTCGKGYSATSSRGDGGRCITCGVARPPPPPPTCASFRSRNRM